MDRRQFLISGGSVFALALTPSVATAAPAAPFVPPTTNIVHLACRIAETCKFKGDDVLRMLSVDPDTFKATRKERPGYMEDYDLYVEDQNILYYDDAEEMRTLAEKGAHDIYECARLVIGIRRKLNLHFNFSIDEQVAWMDRPNPHLKGMTFREVMKADLQLAAEVVDTALQS
jgi:hypothetical protein